MCKCFSNEMKFRSLRCGGRLFILCNWFSTLQIDNLAKFQFKNDKVVFENETNLYTLRGDYVVMRWRYKNILAWYFWQRCNFKLLLVRTEYLIIWFEIFATREILTILIFSIWFLDKSGVDCCWRCAFSFTE